jgi:hypothetical protein
MAFTNDTTLARKRNYSLSQTECTNGNQFANHNSYYLEGCGRSLVGERQKGNVYYRCHGPGCKGTSMREEQIVPAVRAVCSLPDGMLERGFIEEGVERCEARGKELFVTAVGPESVPPVPHVYDVPENSTPGGGLRICVNLALSGTTEKAPCLGAFSDFA